MLDDHEQHGRIIHDREPTSHESPAGVSPHMTQLISTPYESPVGTLTLVAGDAGLRAVIWPDGRLTRRSRRRELTPGEARCSTHRRPSSTSTSPATARPSTSRSTSRAPVPARGLAGAGRDPVRRDPHLRRAGGPDRAADGGAGRRSRERPQSGLDRPALPSRDRQQRRAPRVRRRARGEGGAARARAAAETLASG